MLEPGSESSDSEDDFIGFKGFYKKFQKGYQFLDFENYGGEDDLQKRLLSGVIDRNAFVKKKVK